MITQAFAVTSQIGGPLGPGGIDLTNLQPGEIGEKTDPWKDEFKQVSIRVNRRQAKTDEPTLGSLLDNNIYGILAFRIREKKYPLTQKCRVYRAKGSKMVETDGHRWLLVSGKVYYRRPDPTRKK